MALDYERKVAIPPHTVRVPNGDKVYIQYVIRAYRDEKGRPNNQRVSIGKLDPESGLMIPNSRYYELFGEEPRHPEPTIVRSSGGYSVFHSLAKELGLERIVKRVFPDRWNAILGAAQYMLSEGNVMYYLDDWQEEHITYPSGALSSVKIGKLFSSITETDRLGFFSEWMKNKPAKEYLAYDVTSISSYGRGMESLEWGYNRDKEKLPQINFGMYYGEESGLPMYYRIKRI